MTDVSLPSHVPAASELEALLDEFQQRWPACSSHRLRSDFFRSFLVVKKGMSPAKADAFVAAHTL